MKFLLKSLLALLLIFIVLHFTGSEYDLTPELEDFDKELRQFLTCFGIQDLNLSRSLKQTFYKKRKKYTYFGREYLVEEDFPFEDFRKCLEEFLKGKGYRLKSYSQDLKGKRAKYEIFYKGLHIYTLALKGRKQALLAIVIDDWGYDPKAIGFLGQLKGPLNIAILPGLAYSHTVSKIANLNGHEVLLHLPLEPLPSEKTEGHLEPYTVKCNTSKDEMLSRIREFIAELENVKGVSNHMGSLFSQNERSMSNLLAILKELNLYYLDNKVVSDSVALRISKKVGIKCYQRDIFLDNQGDPVYIKNQLKKAIKIARERGYAIAVGHAKISTLETLKEALTELQDVKLVRLSELR